MPLHQEIADAGAAAALGASERLAELRAQRGDRLTVTIARRELRTWLRNSPEGAAVEQAVERLLHRQRLIICYPRSRSSAGTGIRGCQPRSGGCPRRLCRPSAQRKAVTSMPARSISLPNRGSLYWSAAPIGERNGDDAIGHIDVAAPTPPSATGSLADDPESKPAQDGQRFRVCHVPNRNWHRS